jgi:hypothetical protein
MLIGNLVMYSAQVIMGEVLSVKFNAVMHKTQVVGWALPTIVGATIPANNIPRLPTLTLPKWRSIENF